MGKLFDFLTGKKAAARREVRDQLSREADMAVDEVLAEADALRAKRQRLQGVLDDLTERRRGHNA